MFIFSNKKKKKKPTSIASDVSGGHPEIYIRR